VHESSRCVAAYPRILSLRFRRKFRARPKPLETRVTWSAWKGYPACAGVPHAWCVQREVRGLQHKCAWRVGCAARDARRAHARMASSLTCAILAETCVSLLGMRLLPQVHLLTRSPSCAPRVSHRSTRPGAAPPSLTRRAMCGVGHGDLHDARCATCACSAAPTIQASADGSAAYQARLGPVGAMRERAEATPIRRARH